jgi:DNA polymerase-3 subunit beta
MATINFYRKDLKAASRFMAVKDIRYYLCGLLIESNPMESRIIATDGHILIVNRCDAKDDNAGNFTGIIPADTVKTILSWKPPYKNAGDNIPIVITAPDDAAGEHRVEWCGNAAVFKLIDAKFPDYRRIIPESASGDAAFYNPDYLVKVARAADDYGRKDSRFVLKYNGDSAGVAVINNDCFVVIMPMRQDQADISAALWAKAAMQPDAAPQSIAA